MVVADGVPLTYRALAPNGAACKKHGFCQGGLATSLVSDEDDIANFIGVERWHHVGIWIQKYGPEHAATRKDTLQNIIVKYRILRQEGFRGFCAADASGEHLVGLRLQAGSFFSFVMAWFERKQKGILTTRSGQADVPAGHWTKCGNCAEINNRARARLACLGVSKVQLSRAHACAGVFRASLRRIQPEGRRAPFPRILSRLWTARHTRTGSRLRAARPDSVMRPSAHRESFRGTRSALPLSISALSEAPWVPSSGKSSPGPSAARPTASSRWSWFRKAAAPA